MTHMSITRSEFDGRILRVREEMRRRALDVLLITRPENMFFTTGFRAAHIAHRTGELPAVIVPADAPPRLMTRSLEAAVAACQWTSDPILFDDHDNPYALLKRMLDPIISDKARMGIEERHLRVSQYRKLGLALPDVEFVDATGLIEKIGAYPGPDEMARMKRAAAITQIGLAAGVAKTGVGIYPYEIIGHIHEAMYSAGQSDFDKSLVAVWSGPTGGRMHDTLTTEKIGKSDIVTIEVMGVDDHYRAGSQASVYVGKNPPPEVCAAYATIMAMHDAAKAAVKAGATTGDVFDAANSIYRKTYGRDYYRRCGGSMGVTQFQLDVAKGRKDILTPGVPLLIQPLVGEPALLACASTVVVTPDGCDELTQPLRGQITCVSAG